MEVADIEHALAEQFDAAHLSVYADYLQSIGDPRGELIALDLQRVPISPRYDRVMADWLGRYDHLLRPQMRFRYGFVSQLWLFDHRRPQDTLRQLFDSPAAPYVLRVQVEGKAARVRDMVRGLIERPHPWLQQLVVRIDGPFEAPDAPVIDDELCRSLADATPSLDSLEVQGTAFGMLGHPHLRAMRVRGPTGVRSLIAPLDEADDAVFESLRYLDLQLTGYTGAGLDPARFRDALSPVRLPRLTRLDLSSPQQRSSPFALLATSRIRHQLTHATLPMVHVQRRDELERLLAEMPHLVELTVAELYCPTATGLPPRVRAVRWYNSPDEGPSGLLDLRSLRR